MANELHVQLLPVCTKYGVRSTCDGWQGREKGQPNISWWSRPPTNSKKKRNKTPVQAGIQLVASFGIGVLFLGVAQALCACKWRDKYSGLCYSRAI